MVVVFHVKGSLATYSVEFKSAEHVIARLTVNGERRRDIPEELEFFLKKEGWTSATPVEEVKNPIILALNQSDRQE